MKNYHSENFKLHIFKSLEYRKLANVHKSMQIRKSFVQKNKNKFFFFLNIFLLAGLGSPLSAPRFLLYVQYLTGCRELNPSCCDRNQVYYQWATHIPPMSNTHTWWATHTKFVFLQKFWLNNFTTNCFFPNFQFSLLFDPAYSTGCTSVVWRGNGGHPAAHPMQAPSGSLQQHILPGTPWHVNHNKADQHQVRAARSRHGGEGVV